MVFLHISTTVSMEFLRKERYLPIVKKSLIATFTPAAFKTRRILSDTPWIYGKVVEAGKKLFEEGWKLVGFLITEVSCRN